MNTNSMDGLGWSINDNSSVLHQGFGTDQLVVDSVVDNINDHLIEFQNVKQFKVFSVLLWILQFHVMLLQSMKRQFSLVVHVHFHGLKWELE